jgi:DNA ligase (NAD+)
MDVIDRINTLKKLSETLPTLSLADIEAAISVARDSYYNSDISLISDEIYDLLLERLEQIDPKSKYLHETGASVKGKRFALPYWMGSMNKVKSDEKVLNNWTKQHPGPYFISDKLDGISCLLTCNKGIVNLYTRGDGSFGQNITHLLDIINIPFHKSKNTYAIRGELIMTKTKFEKYSKEMSNARNMVGGVVNSKPESLNKRQARDVDFIAYEVVEPNLKPDQQMKFLKQEGFNVVYYDIYKDIDIAILDNILQKRRSKSDYEIDGIIITDNNKHKRNTFGNPTYSIAYKGTTPTQNVTVIEILWKPSKDGYLVPRIHFEKTRLSQADLQYTTGFNAKFIVDNKIGPGAVITIVRSGDVIPYIMGVVKPAKIGSLPNNVDYVWDKNKVNIILKNADKNRTVIVQRLTKFVKDIGVDNLSEGIIAQLVKTGHNTIPKILQLKVSDLLIIDGFKETLANKIYNNIQKAVKNLDILTLMVASNLFGRGFGAKKIKKVLVEYPNIVKEYNAKSYDRWHKKLMDIDGFDTVSVDAFLKALPDFQNFYDIISGITKIKPFTSRITKNGIFKDQIVVFTGFRLKDWEKFIETEGGKLSGSVSKNTTLLVYNDGEESSAKYQAAKKLGITTIPKSVFAKTYEI